VIKQLTFWCLRFILEPYPPNPIRRDKPAQRFRRKANLFKKGLIENPKQRRDQTAQRLRLNGFGSTLVLKRAELWVREMIFLLRQAD
jgi:hypothetical protein